MKIERKDLFDFKVTLTESEFSMLKAVANEYDNELEDMVEWILSEGLKDRYETIV